MAAGAASGAAGIRNRSTKMGCVPIDVMDAIPHPSRLRATTRRAPSWLVNWLVEKPTAAMAISETSRKRVRDVHSFGDEELAVLDDLDAEMAQEPEILRDA